MTELNENARKNATRNGNTSESLNPKTIEKSMEGASKKIEMAHEIEKIIKDKSPGGKVNMQDYFRKENACLAREPIMFY